MALLVLAGNLAVLLIGWTGVGISSFLLISFWRDRPGTLGAGLQALAANAIGDGALLLAAVLVPTGCGALVTLGTPACTAGPGGAELLATLLFIAAAAKSAQGPLYFWLPNAMAGPTPISALIHAATMVAAGVYLLVRTHALLELAPDDQPGDRRRRRGHGARGQRRQPAAEQLQEGHRVLDGRPAGLHVRGRGRRLSLCGVFHLFTHASFKALLFLAAGVVIHGVAGEERLSRLRGLGRAFPLQPTRVLDRLAGADRTAADHRRLVQQGRDHRGRLRAPAR